MSVFFLVGGWSRSINSTTTEGQSSGADNNISSNPESGLPPVKTDLFAAVMQVQGESKIYVYDTTKFHKEITDPKQAENHHPIMRIYEAGVSFFKVRFVNEDRWLTSFGEATGNNS